MAIGLIAIDRTVTTIPFENAVADRNAVVALRCAGSASGASSWLRFNADGLFRYEVEQGCRQPDEFLKADELVPFKHRSRTRRLYAWLSEAIIRTGA